MEAFSDGVVATRPGTRQLEHCVHDAHKHRLQKNAGI